MIVKFTVPGASLTAIDPSVKTIALSMLPEVLAAGRIETVPPLNEIVQGMDWS